MLPSRRASANHFHVEVEPGEQSTLCPQPVALCPAEFHRDTPCTAGDWRVADKHTSRLGALDDVLQPPPGGERQPLERVRRRFPGVECDEPEVSCLQHKGERFDRAIECPLIHVAAETG